MKLRFSLVCALLFFALSCCGCNKPTVIDLQAETISIYRDRTVAAEASSSDPAAEDPATAAPDLQDQSDPIRAFILPGRDETNPWGLTGDKQPAAEREYVLNTNSKKFHFPDCESVSKMKTENRAYVTAARDDLLQKGYTPCNRCNP